MDKKQLRNTLMLMACAFIWGTAFVAQSVGSDYMGPYTFLASRSWLACAFLLGLMAVLRKMGKTNPAAEPGFWQNKSAAARRYFLRCGAVCGVRRAADGHWHGQHGQGGLYDGALRCAGAGGGVFWAAAPASSCGAVSRPASWGCICSVWPGATR